MTKDEQRIAIAEACGWTYVKVITSPEGETDVVGIKPNYPAYSSPALYLVPDYLNDLNAMHEAEMMLDDSSWRIPGTILKGSLGLFDAYSSELSERFGRSIRATAAQRAESFLRTIGKWKEAPCASPR